MRILVSTPTFLPLVGGAQLGIHEIYRRVGRQHEVTILTPSLKRVPGKGYSVEGDYESENYTVRHILPAFEKAAPQLARGLRRTSLAYASELLATPRHHRPDVVNFHFASPQLGALMLVKWVHRVPTALSLVGRSDVLRLLSPAKRWYAKRAIASADAVIPNSTYYLGSDAASARAEVIPYGVDTTEFAPTRRSRGFREQLGLTEDHFVLFSVQRLTQVKRVDQLIRAMVPVVSREPKAVLVLAGKGQEEAPLRALVKQLRLHDNVRFLGYVEGSRLPECFASSDAFVFHSMLETFGIVFAQAMSCGLPIVAANTSCVPDVLTSRNGLLIAPFELEQFANAILTLIGSPTRAAEIGQHNRERALREFDWDSIASRYESVFDDLAAGRLSAGRGSCSAVLGPAGGTHEHGTTRAGPGGHA
jgi:glycosyltransferase involved in cell wall biosynthesis